MKNLKRRKKPLILVLLLLTSASVWLLWPEPDVAAPQPAVPAPAPTAATETPSPPAAFNTKMYSLSDPESIWVIVNKQRDLAPLNYAPDDLVSVGGGQTLRQAAAGALASLITEAQADGFKLNPLSGYRSYARQQVVYQNEVNTYGQAVADTESARPGHSEHQTGLAIDVGGGGCGIEDCFGNTPHGKWLAANAYRFGFIIRYPQGKQAVTGYRYEPWHIRYVGTDLAGEMQRRGVLTLEEFFGL